MALEKVVITQIDVLILMNAVPFLTFANKGVPICGDHIVVTVVQDIAWLQMVEAAWILVCQFLTYEHQFSFLHTYVQSYHR